MFKMKIAAPFSYCTTPRMDCLLSGGDGTHYAEDLTSILEAPLRSLAAQYDPRLKIVGARGEPKLAKVLGAVDGLMLDLVDEVNWSDLEAMADFDIGLYLLIENKFNIYKCAFKAPTLLATSAPLVASNVGANGDVITHGSDGCLVSSPDEWVACLSSLISDDNNRRELGASGHVKTEKNYSNKALAARILDLL